MSNRAELDQILCRYQDGIILEYDAAVSAAGLVNEDNIDEYFQDLPPAVQRHFKAFAEGCDEDNWIRIGSRETRGESQGSRPVSENTVKLLKAWLERMHKSKRTRRD